MVIEKLMQTIAENFQGAQNETLFTYSRIMLKPYLTVDAASI